MRRSITPTTSRILVLLCATVAAWLARHATAPAVRAWSPGGGERRRLGELGCRTFGRGDDGILLLHGLVSSGDQFGRRFDVLGTRSRVLAPDLLGFGRSCDLDASSFTLEDHLQAIDHAIEAAGLAGTRLTVAGHSLGAVMALHVAARRRLQVGKVVMWSPPIAQDRERGKEAIRRMGLLERLFALEGPLARGACRWMCRHRRASAVIALLLNPSVPAALSIGSVRHTWPAYRDVMEGVILDQSWRDALLALHDAGIPVVMASGERDEVADPDLHRELARRHPNVEVRTARGAAHLLPITHAEWCLEQLAGIFPGMYGPADGGS